MQTDHNFALKHKDSVWAKGDIVYNTGAAAGGKVGWVCVTAGTPGTWKAFGAIDN